MRLCLPKLIVHPVFLKSTEVLYRRWTVHAASEFGERSGRKRVRVPEGMAKAQGRKREGNRPRSRKAPGAREGNRDGHNESLEATARKRREGKEALLHGFDDALRQGQAKGHTV